MDKDCRTCEFYDRQRPPGAGFLQPRVPYCTGLGFVLQSTGIARECKLYTARRAVNTRRVP